MAKKKFNRGQMQKVQSAQHKKVFMQKLRGVCEMLGDGCRFELFSDLILRAIYENRGTTCTIRVAKGARVTKRLVKIMYGHIGEQLKREMMGLVRDGKVEVSLTDYYQVIYPLERVLVSNFLPFKGEEGFSMLREVAMEHYEEYIRQVSFIIYCACSALSDLSKHCLYTFNYEERDESDTIGDFRKRQIVTIDSLPLDVRYVTIEGERRQVCAMGEVRHKEAGSYVEPTEVLLSRLNVAGAGKEEKARVYIQQHAVDRIMTRAYCAFPGTVITMINRAFMGGNAIVENGRNRYLIECLVDGVKIGYFAAVYVEGILVIRTFLLITHGGTPEGRRLEQLTGLQRKDKTYLALDDLRALANSDIIDDATVRQIFIDVGCESILQLCRNVREGYEQGWLWDKNSQSRELSRLMLEYIQLGNRDEEYFVNEE